MDELGRIYAAEASGRVADLPPVAFLPTDFVRLQAEALAGPGGDQLRAYWDEALGGELAVLNLPMDRPRSSLRTRCGATRSHPTGRSVAADLVALGHAQARHLVRHTPGRFSGPPGTLRGTGRYHRGNSRRRGGHPGSSSMSVTSSTPCRCGLTCQGTRLSRNSWGGSAELSTGAGSTKTTRSP